MKINEIADESPIPPILYHATLLSNIPSIKQYGIQPGSRQNYDESDAGLVYLADTSACAIGFVKGTKNTALAVDTSKLSPNALFPDPFYGVENWGRDNPHTGHFFAYRGIIPPTATINI